ncbi:transmembrane protein 81-like [Thalassophryne amazonica]|uniref:transmembrane protein 81-like n=1 Tax=Thalassophryne amazonica TaxID=390379 RepID=UPI001470EE80|nr:transmembrane protein 81-like [Thalassophryne amazonica]
MHHVPVNIGLLLFLLFQLLTSADLEETELMDVEVVISRTPCSATCGWGFKLRRCVSSEVERKSWKKHQEVSDKCRVRKVNCLQMLWCGLKTFTVTAGDRVELNCLQEVLEDKGRFSWRVIWCFAKGLITPEDALFAHLKAPMMDRVILDPVTESDAGTYRCTVLDSGFHRVKRIEWGIRVLPVGFMDLQYHSSQDDWDQQNQTVSSTQQNKESCT